MVIWTDCICSYKSNYDTIPTTIYWKYVFITIGYNHKTERPGCAIASVFASNQIEDCKNGICCFSCKHAALISNNEEWQDNVTLSNDCCFTSIINIQLGAMLWYKRVNIIISELFSSWYSWNVAHIALYKNHSLTTCDNISSNVSPKT
jgi:hypothetical protein